MNAEKTLAFILRRHAETDAQIAILAEQQAKAGRRQEQIGKKQDKRPELTDALKRGRNGHHRKD